MPKKSQIEHFIMMGDSLSDRGTMDHRKLFDVIPMDGLVGLKSKSPQGRFTNGYVWGDHFSAALAEEAIIKKLKQRGNSSSDISDDIITHSPSVEKPLHDDFNLDENMYVNLKGQDFVRNYDEGGLTSYDYSKRITFNLGLAATEKILSTLSKKRQLLLQDDKARQITQDHKNKSLIIEWSGANDLITVNTKPTREAANKALEARLENLEILIKNGYRNFALFNLPDLSLTPRYQRKSIEEQENAHDVSMYFNERLQDEIRKLSEKYKECSINVFDINKTFTEAYNDPKSFGLDPEKKHTPYTTSKDFTLQSNGTSPANGYMFWDDVHPTSTLHAHLANKFYDEFDKTYHFRAPHESLLAVFKETYGQKWSNDQKGFFGFFRRTRLDYKSDTLTLESILKHALYDGGHRTRDIITQLGWVNKNGELISKHPSLQQAMKNIEPALSQSMSFN